MGFKKKTTKTRKGIQTREEESRKDLLPLSVVVYNDLSAERGLGPKPKLIDRPTYRAGFDYSKIVDGVVHTTGHSLVCNEVAAMNFNWATNEYPDADSVRIRVGSLGLMGVYALHWSHGGYYHRKVKDFAGARCFIPGSGLDAHCWVEVEKNGEKFIIDPDFPEKHKMMARNYSIGLNSPNHPKTPRRDKDLKVKVERDYYERIYKIIEDPRVEMEVVIKFLELGTIKHSRGNPIDLGLSEMFFENFQSGLRGTWKKG